MRLPVLLAALWLAGASCERPRSCRLWVADRGAGALLALDQELCLLTRVPLPGARLVVVEGDRLACVARAPAAPEEERLIRLTPSGESLERSVRTLAALAGDGTGTLFALEAADGATTLLWRFDSALRATLLGAFPEACALAVRGGELLVGCRAGDLLLVRADGVLLAATRRTGAVRALTPGPRRHEWWALLAEGRLALLTPALDPAWERVLDSAAASFAPVAGEERVWIVAGERLQRWGACGALECELALPSGPWEAAAATADGVVLSSPGALLDVVLRGGRLRVARTQGGFDALDSLAGLPAGGDAWDQGFPRGSGSDGEP